jgi:hypothetical protein
MTRSIVRELLTSLALVLAGASCEDNATSVVAPADAAADGEAGTVLDSSLDASDSPDAEVVDGGDGGLACWAEGTDFGPCFNACPNGISPSDVCCVFSTPGSCTTAEAKSLVEGTCVCPTIEFTALVGDACATACADAGDGSVW